MPAVSFTADFIAGWLAGGAGLLIGHPLDTIKVRLQALKDYENVLQCVRQTLRHEAIGGFYKGMLFPLLSAGMLHSLYFGGHGVTVKLLKNSTTDDENGDVSSPFGHLIAGSIIGATFQWIPACPIEIIKTKLQVQKASKHHTFGRWSDLCAGSKGFMGGRPAAGARVQLSGPILFASPLDCIRQTVRSEGIAGLYRGGLIMLVRDVVGFCSYLPVYEAVKSCLTTACRPAGERTSDHPTGESLLRQNRLAISLIAGGIAGVASWFPILPFDLIKSRLQADDLIRPKYKGVLHCARESLQKDGFSIFFRGWQVVVIRAVPVNAVLFLCYDETLQYLNRCQVLW